MKGPNIRFVNHIKYLSVIPFQHYSFNFCVPLHADASVIVRLLKTKALLEIRAGLRHVGNPNKCL